MRSINTSLKTSCLLFFLFRQRNDDRLDSYRKWVLALCAFSSFHRCYHDLNRAKIPLKILCLRILPAVLQARAALQMVINQEPFLFQRLDRSLNYFFDNIPSFDVSNNSLMTFQ
jgi:hypothetical protein